MSVDESVAPKRDGAAKEDATEKDTVVVKKYANRRLYNTETSTYVTLDDLAQMVRDERDFVVRDAKTGEDLTHCVLTQIIVEQESKGQSLLPIPFLRQLIRFYGDSIERLVPSYLELSLNTLTRQQERYRQQFADTFGTAAIEAMQEQARQNLAMFEKALAMFAPFGAKESETGERESAQKGGGAREPSGEGAGEGQGAKTKVASEKLARLEAQLAAMQDQIDKLAGKQR